MLAGNKSDLYNQEEVDEAEARKFAKEIGAFFKLTSAATDNGINEAFNVIACKLFNPDFVDSDEIDIDVGNKNDDNKDDENNNKKEENIEKEEKKEKEEKIEKNDSEIKNTKSIKLDSNKVKESKEKKKCC